MPANHFTITAECPGGARHETRVSPASAIVLADRWVQGGCSNVVLIDPRGTAWERSAFRARLPQMKKLDGRPH